MWASLAQSNKATKATGLTRQLFGEPGENKLLLKVVMLVDVGEEVSIVPGEKELCLHYHGTA